MTTIADFWRMIWEQNVSIIVMVTNCREGNDEKCQQYWSDEVGEPFEGYEAHITLQKVVKLPDFTVREFSVVHQMTRQERTVTQLHYTSWPDFDVPRENPIGILKFIRKVRQVQETVPTTPILVHCSAGCGRTGTFIAIAAMLEMLEKERRIDVSSFTYQYVIFSL